MCDLILKDGKRIYIKKILFTHSGILNFLNLILLL